MQIITIGEKYEISGGDYDIKISPIKEQDSFKSSFIDFTLCEEILRAKYNISSDEILTFLKTGIDKKNEIVLNNQIEYAIYDEKRIQLNYLIVKMFKLK